MGLHLSLMATVATLMAWVVQRQNGGILNVLFSDISTGADPNFGINLNLTDSIIGYVKNMLLLKPLPLTILKALPKSVGGGVAGVTDALEHPNREAFIFWITLSVFLLAIVLIILIQIINCCCCCCKGKNPQKVVEEAQFRNKQIVFRIIYITFFVIALAFLVASVIVLVMYFSSIGVVTSYLEASPISSLQNQIPHSLPDGLRSTIMHIMAFLTNGIQSGRKLTTDTINRFVNGITNKLSEEASKLIDKLIEFLNIADITTKGNNAISAIRNLSASISAVGVEVDDVKTQVQNFEKELESALDIYSLAFDSIKVCGILPACKLLKNQLTNAKSPIDSSTFNTGVINGFLTSLNNSEAEVSKQINEISKYMDKIKESQVKILDSVKSSLNIASIFKVIDGIWVEIDRLTSALLKQVDDVIAMVEHELLKYIPNIRIGYYVVGGIFLLVMLIAVVIAIRLIFQAVKGRLLTSKSCNVTADGKWDKIVCGKFPVCCCSGLFIPLLLVFAAIIAVLLFLFTTLSGEVCIYLVKENAITKTDAIVNSVIEKEWQTIVGSIAPGVGDIINIPTPRNVLRALTKTCDYQPSNKTQGLLTALGFRNLVNINGLLKGPEVVNGIANGKVEILKQIKDLDIASKLPSEADLSTQMNTIKTAVNSFDLTAILLLMDPAVLNPVELEALLAESKALTSTLSIVGINPLAKADKALEGAIASLKALKTPFEKAKKLLENLNSIKTNVLPPLTQLIESIKYTLKAAQDLQNKVSTQYDALSTGLTTLMQIDGDQLFTELTRGLLPCKEASAAYGAVMAVTCGDEGGVNRLIGLTYILAINILFLAFLYFALYNLAFIQAQQIRSISSSRSGT